MDTAKVDIRKLQLLNDRNNQCIDALNQVRLSVHGLSHASAVQQGALGQVPFGQVPYGTPYNAGWASPYTGVGLGQPFANPIAGNVPFGLGAAGINPGIGLGPFGLSHSSAETAYGDPYRQGLVDPMLMSRIVQTFPYAYTPGVTPGIAF